MDEQDVVDIHNGLLHSHYKGWDHAISDNMGGSRGYYTK